MSMNILPFSLQLPAGYSLSGGTGTDASASSASAASTTSATPADVVTISNTYDAGSFTAEAGDIIALNALIHAQTGTSQAVVGYRLALGNGDGRLLLDGNDVTDRTSFTADEFKRLTYTAGALGSQQNIVVVAQTGTRLSDGSLSQVVDSPAAQITADITGSRSINTLNALRTVPTGNDANVVGVVQEAGIFSGLANSPRPTLQTAGNFTAAANDVYRVSSLFSATAPAGKTIAGYGVALGNGGGTLLLDGVATDRTSFTADEFTRLTYEAGAQGSQQDIVVVAQTGKRMPDGSLSQAVDSQAVQITADVTGSRSINAMDALSTTSTGADANVVGVVQEAGIFNGLANSGRPTLQTDGNFTAAAGDVFRMSGLFNASTSSGQAVAGYRVALGQGDGKLMLDGTDVSDRTNFTADEFRRLTYTAGSLGAQQDIVVVAQTGKRMPDGSLSQVVDSQAVQVTADVTGAQSINAMNALASTPVDANVAMVVQEAGIFSGLANSPRPGLQTAGNFTAAAGDVYRLSGLFNGSAPAGETIAGYRVALGQGGGTLMLDGNDVTDRTSFSADEFRRLTYTASAQGSQQDIVVVAQTGKRLPDGSLSQVVDSPAVQISADVTGSRSVNAMSALSTAPTGTDANVISVVQEAGIFTGLANSGRPTLKTDGNFTAAAGDVYRLNGLFSASAPAGKTIAGYRVALGAGDGMLLLDGNDVTDRTSFTADEFRRLTYTAGTQGQDIVVVAQTGKLMPDGSLSQVVDSPAVQITADVTGSRSINAMNALGTTVGGADANVVDVVQEAGIFTGLANASRPSLESALGPQPSPSASTLETGIGAFQSAGATTGSDKIDMSSLDPSAISASATPGVFTSLGSQLATALLLLGGSATGAFQTAGELTQTSEAIQAYRTTRDL